MKRSIIFEVLLIAALLFLQSSGSVAALFNASKSLEGTVQEIHANLITIAPNPSSEAAMIKVEVEVDKNTQFKKVNALTELKKGDAIRVEYKEEQEGKKVALEIAKLSPGQGASSPEPQVE